MNLGVPAMMMAPPFSNDSGTTIAMLIAFVVLAIVNVGFYMWLTSKDVDHGDNKASK